MLEEELNKLLEKNWEAEEKQLVKRIMDGLLYYKRFLPKNFKDDVLMSIQLCNKLKNELETLKVKNIEKIQENIKENTEENIKNMCVQIDNLRKDIEELRTIILTDKKRKINVKYKFYKNINAKLNLFKK
jgi:hypothetical protein